MKKSTIVAKFNSPVEKVWAIVTDTAVFDWRSDLSKVVVFNNGKGFTEYTKSGFETEFVITMKKM